MASHSRRYNSLTSEVEKGRRYEIPEAVELVKRTATAGFDETVAVTLKLGIDAKRSDQVVRGAVSLPHGIGKEVRVIAFADGEAAEQARQAGAVEVGADELVEKVSGGWLDFDVAIAHPGMMAKVGRLGRTLGPKGLMPSPRSGTVTEDVATAVREYIAGRVEYRADGTGCVHAPVGKASFSAEQLADNVSAFIDHVAAQRPAASKGLFLRKGYVAATMGPGVEISLGRARQGSET